MPTEKPEPKPAPTPRRRKSDEALEALKAAEKDQRYSLARLEASKSRFNVEIRHHEATIAGLKAKIEQLEWARSFVEANIRDAATDLVKTQGALEALQQDGRKKNVKR
jgi:chromosome segregation ATPase